MSGVALTATLFRRMFGSPRFEGERFWIDVAKPEKAGVKVHETATVIEDFDRIIAIGKSCCNLSSGSGSKLRKN